VTIGRGGGAPRARRIVTVLALLFVLGGVVAVAVCSSPAAADQSKPYVYPEITQRDIEEASRSDDLGGSGQSRRCIELVPGGTGRILPETSQTNCAEIAHLTSALPREPGGFLLSPGTSRRDWRCHLYPVGGGSQDLLSCSRGKAKFSIVRISQSS
jgi:hypothetical protein